MAAQPFKDLVIFDNGRFNVGQDWEIPIPGFFIVAPNTRIKSLDKMTQEQAIELTRITHKVRQGMREVLGINTVYIFQDEDASNYHLRIFPRLDRMKKFGKKIQSVRPIMEWAKENMMDEKTFEQVENRMEKMKQYMESK